MKRSRIIPILNLHNGELHKTQKFKNPIYLGDPHIAVRILNDLEVDELIVVDYSNKEPDIPLLKDLASEAFMPMVYGGGIRNMDQFEMIIRSGFEKISLNTMPLENPDLVRHLVEVYGSSTLVASVDLKKGILGSYSLVNRNVDKKTLKKDFLDYCHFLEDLGFGEIMVNIVDRESEMKGGDIELADLVSSSLKVPVLYQGGVGSSNDIIELFQSSDISGVVCGSFFVLNGKLRTPLVSYLEEEDFKEIEASLNNN